MNERRDRKDDAGIEAQAAAALWDLCHFAARICVQPFRVRKRATKNTLTTGGGARWALQGAGNVAPSAAVHSVLI